jgi:hypothetical protein
MSTQPKNLPKKRRDLDLKNRLKVEFLRRNPETGELVKYDEDTNPNGITDVGIHHLLDVVFDQETAATNWYIGLVNNAGFSAFANGDTMASHAGWTEFTNYSEGDRPEWVPAAAAARAIENDTTVDFTIGGSGTLQGAFIVNEDTKSGTTGVLWATIAFSSPKAVDSSTVLRLTYTVEG